ncbi:MAG: galactose mutarotase [Bacteroidales bacterium]|jgi:aldose 1-epimerase|nr:galactose mutarotase [Bacteroidales bacterium]
MKTANFLLGIVLLVSCAQKQPTVTQIEWGTVESKTVNLYTLANSNELSVDITNYGGIVVAFRTPDRNGEQENIVLGLGSLNDYLVGHPSLGCIVGRYANRIAGARFTLNDVEYSLVANTGRNHIHGGVKQRFDLKVWDASTSSDENSATLTLHGTSADMEEGYPGNLDIEVRYVLNNDNELQIHYTAVSHQPTVLKLTKHSYFNLTGCKENVLRHQAIVYADEYTPVDEENIPTGEILPVEGTPYDLRTWTTIGDRIKALPRGYDNNYCLKTQPQPVLAAELYDPQSGRLLQTYTTEPGVQFYTSVNLDGHKKNEKGIALTSFMGACFEAQHYPDSPNHPNFPSTVLNPGETYRQTTIYKVGVK